MKKKELKKLVKMLKKHLSASRKETLSLLVEIEKLTK